MADNVSIKDASAATVVVLADELTDATLGTGEAQYMKLMDGTLNSSTKVVAMTSSPVGNEGGLVTRPLMPQAAAAAITLTAADASGAITTPTAGTPTAGSYMVYSPAVAPPYGTLGISVRGTFTGTMWVDVMVEGGYWITQQYVINAGTGTISSGITAPGAYLIAIAGSVAYRVRLGAGGTATSPSVALNLSSVPLVPPITTVNQGTNPWTVQGQQSTRFTGSLISATAVAGPFAVSNLNIATITISGTYAGVTAVFEGTDDGTNWYGMQGTRGDASIVENGPTALTNTSRSWDLAIGGFTQIRVRATAWTSGTAAIGCTLQAMPYEPSPAVGLSSIGGTALLAKAVPTGGQGLVAVPVYTNAIQALTYTFGARGILTGALTANTAKQVFSLEVAAGNAKTVRVRRVLISGYQSAALAGITDIQMTRGVAASTGGTAVTAGVRVVGDATPQTVCKTLPTITAATVLDTLPFAANGAAAASAQPMTVLYDWQEAGETKPWTLVPGSINSLVFSVIASAALNWTLTFHVTLTEE